MTEVSSTMDEMNSQYPKSNATLQQSIASDGSQSGSVFSNTSVSSAYFDDENRLFWNNPLIVSTFVTNLSADRP